MAKIAVILMDHFEDWDYVEPMDFLKSEGYELIHVGLREGMTVKGRQGTTEVTIDRAVGDVAAEAFDAVLIPRGYTLDEVKAAKDVVEWVKDFLETGKPVWRASTKSHQGSGTQQPAETRGRNSKRGTGPHTMRQEEREHG